MPDVDHAGRLPTPPGRTGAVLAPTSRREVALRWFVFLGGMSAFALHLLLTLYLLPATCALGSAWPTYGLTAAFMGVTVAAILLGWRRTKGRVDGERGGWAPGRGAHASRARFMVIAGQYLNVLALLFLLYFSVSMAAFDPCVNWMI